MLRGIKFRFPPFRFLTARDMMQTIQADVADETADGLDTRLYYLQDKTCAGAGCPLKGLIGLGS